MSRSALTTGILLCYTIPVSRGISTRYGRCSGRHFLFGAGASLAIQQVLVGQALLHVNRREFYRLRFVDVLTLSRGGAAAILVGVVTSGARDRTGYAGWLSWYALLYGCTLCDWIDGSIARAMGTSDLGRMLDIETDSWLTLCAAASAAAWGGLPRAVVAPPILRYVLLSRQARHISYEATFATQQRWERSLGICQMLLLIAALSPIRGRATGAIMQVVAPIEIGVQIFAFGIRLLRQI